MFREDEDRSARYDARACEQYIAYRERESGTAVCGLCLYICPHGRKNPKVAKPGTGKPGKP
jgi:epoxyqueuosine reductase QueG